MSIERWKPSVESHWLLLLAGITWTGVGVMLGSLAIGWLQQTTALVMLLFELIGLALSLTIYRFGFSKLAFKNITRICAMTGKLCPTAFQTKKSYLTTVVMIGLGLVLRNSPIPKPDLAILYLGIGGALLLASCHYYLRLIQIVVPNSLKLR